MGDALNRIFQFHPFAADLATGGLADAGPWTNIQVYIAITVLLALLGWMRMARTIRSLLLSIENKDYIGVVAQFSHRTVMYMEKIVEMAGTRTVFSCPVHPYTGALLSAVPLPDPEKDYDVDPLKGEIPSLHDIPPGCRFSTRCRYTQANCFTEEPSLRQIGDSLVACHRGGEINITTNFV